MYRQIFINNRIVISQVNQVGSTGWSRAYSCNNFRTRRTDNFSFHQAFLISPNYFLVLSFVTIQFQKLKAKFFSKSLESIGLTQWFVKFNANSMNASIISPNLPPKSITNIIDIIRRKIFTEWSITAEFLMGNLLVKFSSLISWKIYKNFYQLLIIHRIA